MRAITFTHIYDKRVTRSLSLLITGINSQDKGNRIIDRVQSMIVFRAF
jgi:hypothetical protein